MRNNFTAFLLVTLIALAGCSGPDSYLGEWKATSVNGDRYTVVFRPKTISIKRASGDSLNIDYTQNAVKIDNTIRAYGIKLSNGKAYHILFPHPNDLSKCLITVENNEPLYALSRTTYLSHDAFNQLSR